MYHSIDDHPEDNVSPIEPGGLNSGDEELRAVGVLARVGHAQPSRTLVLELEVLILEFVAIDTLACGKRKPIITKSLLGTKPLTTCTVSLSEITTCSALTLSHECRVIMLSLCTLNHEIFDNTMKDTALVSEVFLQTHNSHIER